MFYLLEIAMDKNELKNEYRKFLINTRLDSSVKSYVNDYLLGGFRNVINPIFEKTFSKKFDVLEYFTSLNLKTRRLCTAPLSLDFIYNKFHLLSRNCIFHNYSVAVICNGYSLVWEVYSFYGSCSSKSFFHVILISLYTLLFLCMPDCKYLASHIKKNEDYICSPHYLKTIISLL